MLGSGKSSLAIWTAFDTISTATVRLLKWVLKIAWKRAENSGSWATVGASLVGSTDMVQGQATIVSKPDLFYYYDETARATKIEYEREVQEPLGGIALAQADISLENVDGRFTANKGQTCGTALYPNRPMIIQLGFSVMSTDKTLSVFKGLSDQPREDKMTRQLTVHAYDYLKYLNQYELESTVYEDKRSDEIIDDILDTIGFSSDQYVLDVGLNTIGYAWFTKGTKAGDAIRNICEAEEGYFYQDEEGIIRFENRRTYNVAPRTTTQWTIKADDIIEWQEDLSTQIINRCIVKAKPRQVSGVQEVWRDAVVEEVPANSSITIWAQLDNPVTSFSSITATTDYLGNTAIDGSGTNITGSITITVTSFTDTAKLVIANGTGATAYITYLRLRGTPAIITHEINELYEDIDSQNKYARQQLDIVNDFIDSGDYAYYLARAIVRKYKEPCKRINIRIRGVPQLQLRDKISVYDQDLATYKNYRLMRISGILYGASFQQTLTLREIVSGEADGWALVGSSVVEGYDVVGI